MKLQNKKLILSFAAVGLFANSLFANMDEQKIQMPNGMMIKHFYMKTTPIKHHSNKFEKMIVSKIMMLDLSKEQMKQIKEILNNKNEDIKSPLDAFSENDFDKEKFIKTIETNRKSKIEDKAQKISDIYALLTKEQKKDLKTILDMQKIIKKKRMSKMHKQEFQG